MADRSAARAERRRPAPRTVARRVLTLSAAFWAVALGSAGALGLGDVEPTTLVLVALAVALGETMAFHFERGGQAHTVTLGDTALVVGLFHLPPGALVIACTVGTALAVTLARQAPLRLVFNVGQIAFASLAAGLLFRAVAGPEPSIAPGSIGAAYLSATLASILGMAAVTIVIWVAEGVHPPAIPASCARRLPRRDGRHRQPRRPQRAGHRRRAGRSRGRPAPPRLRTPDGPGVRHALPQQHPPRRPPPLHHGGRAPHRAPAPPGRRADRVRRPPERAPGPTPPARPTGGSPARGGGRSSAGPDAWFGTAQGPDGNLRETVAEADLAAGHPAGRGAGNERRPRRPAQLRRAGGRPPRAQPAPDRHPGDGRRGSPNLRCHRRSRRRRGEQQPPPGRGARAGPGPTV